MARQTKNLIVRNEFLILTNGKRSEKNYFELLRKHFKSLYEITVKFMNDEPESLVNHAIKMKSASNHVWCVFDKDDFTNESIYRAINTAKKHGIGVAFSNAAFEVWLIDHFLRCESEKGVSQLNTELDTLLKNNGYSQGYKKADSRVIEEMFIPRLDDACHNADVVYQKYVLEYRESGKTDDSFPICSWNSYTDVHKLIAALKFQNNIL